VSAHAGQRFSALRAGGVVILLASAACKTPAPGADAAADTGSTAADAGSTAGESDQDGGGSVPPTGGDTPLPLPTRLGTRGVFWSKSGSLVATNEESACGPPSGDRACEVRSSLRVVDLGSARREHRHARAELFGFRADGEWLVLREDEGQELEEWSPRTEQKRPSAFAASTKGTFQACLSPDDVHLVVTLAEDGPTVVRSRTAEDETRLDDLETAPLPPADCAFAPDGKAFALAGEEHVAVYRLGESSPDRWLPLANASHLAWSADGASLTFATRDAVQMVWLVYRWYPAQGRLTAHALYGPAAFHPKRPELLTRTGCEWHRNATTDGKLLGRVGPAAETCFHLSEHEVSLSPTGRFVAAVEGEWRSRGLLLLPVK
jgi:hypothetical protein